MRGYGLAAAALLACLCCAGALQCYICNSLVDPDCDTRDVKSEYLKDCKEGRSSNSQGDLGPSAFKPLQNASVCWKQRQDVQGQIIVDRSCGKELAKKDYGCYDRVGTKKIKVRYCVCNMDKCNGSGTVTASAIFVLMSLTGYFISSAWL